MVEGRIKRVFKKKISTERGQMMNSIDSRDFPMHISVLGWLYIFGNAFFLVLAAFGFFLLPTIGAISRDADATTILTVLGTVFGLLMLILAVPGFLAGYGLLKHKSWARLLAMIIAVLGLVNFPFGTVIGIYALFVLSQQSALEYFEPRLTAQPNDVTAQRMGQVQQ
jgi:hypothetical protein